MDFARLPFVVLQVKRSPIIFREVVDLAQELEHLRWPLSLSLSEEAPWWWPHTSGAVILVPPEARTGVLHWLEVEMADTAFRPRHIIVHHEGLPDVLHALESIPLCHRVLPEILKHGEIWMAKPLPRSRWCFANLHAEHRRIVESALLRLRCREAHAQLPELGMARPDGT